MQKQATESHSRSKKSLVRGNRHRLTGFKPWIPVIAVFVLALVIRLLYLNQVASVPVFHKLAIDAKEYHGLANQILRGNLAHPDSVYMNPLYPFFLASIYFIFGQSYLAVVVIQAIVDSASCILIYCIASTLFNGRIGIIAALTYAFYGVAVFYTGTLLAPTLVVFFTLLFIVSMLAAEQRMQTKAFFISGILFGLAVLARPNVILFTFFLPLWFLLVQRNKLGFHKSIRSLLFLLVGFSIVLSFISIRNYAVEKRISPLSVHGGYLLYVGNNPDATGRLISRHGITNSAIDQIKASIQYAEKESGSTMTPSQASRYFLNRAITYVKDNPADAFWLYVKKFALFWRGEEIPLSISYQFSKQFAPILRLPFISFGVIAPLALCGIMLSIKRRENVFLLILFVFSYMISVIIFFVCARYRLPVVPFLIVCSSYFAYHFVGILRAKEFKQIAIWTALAVLLFLGINKSFKGFGFTYSPLAPHTNLGTVYDGRGMYDEAIAEFKKALAIDPNYPRALFNLGVTYAKKGMFDEAITQYKKALSNQPDYAKAHQNLGNAYAKTGKFDEAIYQYRKALSLNEDNVDARTNLGIAYEKKGLLDEAIIQYKKVLSNRPNHVKAHYNLGNAYGKTGRFDEAVAQFRKVLSIDPKYAFAHRGLAVVYAERRMFDEAISELVKAQGLGLPVDPRLLQELTEASEREKRKAGTFGNS
jgi:tetratricopeptide (TPR) repeat protein